MDVAPYTDDLDLASVNGWEELRALLRTVHLRADKPSLRTLEARSRHGATPLSKTVVAEMLKGTRFPRKAVLLAFLQACGIQEEQLEPWLRAWERIAAGAAESRIQGSARGGPVGQPRSSAADVEGRRETVIPPIVPAMEFALPDGALGSAESVETRWLREQVRQLSAENERLRVQMVASEPPTGGDSIRADDGDDHTVHSPSASRRELGVLLRALRERRRITIEQAAERLLCTPGKIHRIESSFRSGTLRDVRDLCDFYEVADDVQRRHLMQLARISRQQGWWQAYDTPDYSTYIDYENDATSIKLYHSAVVPGLMQTVEYARALHQSGPYVFTAERIDQLIQVRLIRQRILTRAEPPNFWAILDEGSLRRSVGGPTAMRDQLERIIEISSLPNVFLQVIPFAAGAHAAMDSSFTILEFNDPVPGMVYAEGLSGFLYVEKPEDVEKHRRTFAELSAAALNEVESIQFITQLIER